MTTMFFVCVLSALVLLFIKRNEFFEHEIQKRAKTRVESTVKAQKAANILNEIAINNLKILAALSESSQRYIDNVEIIDTMAFSMNAKRIARFVKDVAKAHSGKNALNHLFQDMLTDASHFAALSLNVAKGASEKNAKLRLELAAVGYPTLSRKLEQVSLSKSWCFAQQFTKSYLTYLSADGCSVRWLGQNILNISKKVEAYKNSNSDVDMNIGIMIADPQKSSVFMESAQKISSGGHFKIGTSVLHPLLRKKKMERCRIGNGSLQYTVLSFADVQDLESCPLDESTFLSAFFSPRWTGVSEWR